MSSPNDSPDPLRLSTIQTPQSRRQSVKRELSSLAPRDFHSSPAKSVVLDRNDLGGSPWRIKVTVEAEPTGGIAREGSMSPTKAKPAPTVTVKVPLRGANDTPTPAKGRKRKASDADEWVPKRKPTPGRRSSGKIQPDEESQNASAPKKRGRPRKSDASVATAETQEETANMDNDVPNDKPKRGKASPRQTRDIETRASPDASVLRSSPEVVIDRAKEPIDDDQEEPLDFAAQPMSHVVEPTRSSAEQALSDVRRESAASRSTKETTPLHQQRRVSRDLPHAAESSDETQTKRPRKGHLFPDLTGVSFSPLPPRPSPTRFQTTKPKSVTFSSPIRQEYSPAARHTNVVSRDNTVQEDKADAAMWRSMIAQSSDNIDYIESGSDAGNEDEDEAGVSDQGDDISVAPGDYTMMESEEFSMVSINSLPSARENQSSFVSLGNDANPHGQNQEASIFAPGESLTPKAVTNGTQKQEEKQRTASSEPGSETRSTQKRGPSTSENIRRSPKPSTGVGSASSYTPRSDPKSPKPRMSPMQSPGKSLAPSSVRSAGRLPTPSSDMDNVAPSSPLASKQRGTRSMSTASRNPSETSRKLMEAPLSSPPTSSPHIARDYSPLSNLDATSRRSTPRDLQARLRQKREDEWQRDRERVIDRSTHAEDEQIVLVSDQEESEDSDTPDDQQAEPEQNAAVIEDDIDVWEEEASRDSLQNGRRHRGARRGQIVSEASVEPTFTIDDTLPAYPPEAIMKVSAGPIAQSNAPAVKFERRGFMKRDLIATPVRQKRNAADIDAIFANLGKGTEAPTFLDEKKSPPRPIVAARQSLQPPFKLPVPVAQNDRFAESTFDQSVLTTSMLDATTSDVHQIRAEILSAKRAGAPSVPRVEHSSPTPTVRSSRTRASSEMSETYRHEKRQKLMQPTSEEQIVREDNLIDETDDLADGSITNITHASSSLLSLTPKREKSSYKALFSSPINPRTPHILPGPVVNALFVNGDSAPSPPSILESGSPISPPQPSLMSKFLSTIGQGYKPPSRPSHPLLQSLPLLPKIEPFTRTHWQVLHGLYDHCLQYPDLFAPLRTENVSYVTPELAKYIDIEIINWGYGVRLNERLVMVARIFYDLLVLKDVAEYESLYRMRIDRGETCTDRPDGLDIDLWIVLLKVFAIRCGRMMRSDEAKGKVIDRRPGQLRWRFKGEKEWTWAGRM